jgi:hypothetical protein
MKRIVFLALVLAACSASAQVTKCKLPNGTITYGDGPCPAGAADSRVNTTANVVDGSDQRAAAARMRDDQARNDQPTPGAAIIGGGGGGRRPGAPIDDAACRAAQRDLDMAGSRVRTEVARGNHPGPSGSVGQIRRAQGRRRVRHEPGCEHGHEAIARNARTSAAASCSQTFQSRHRRLESINCDCQGAAMLRQQAGRRYQQRRKARTLQPMSSRRTVSTLRGAERHMGTSTRP